MWVVLAVVLRGTDRRCRSSPVFEGDFEGAVEAYRQALDAFVNGDPEHVVKPSHGVATSPSGISLAVAADPPNSSTRSEKRRPCSRTAPVPPRRRGVEIRHC
jgi:hypothetical protein